jgi:hypothetical protein
MLWLRLLQKLIRTLNSDGTPGQVAVGIALGAALGLTPLVNLHNLMIFAVVVVFNVSFPAAILGWLLFTPVGFLLDPAFDAVGGTLLSGAPVSLIGWVVLAVPIYLLARVGVAKYREKVLPRLEKTKLFRAVKASKLYNIYRLLQPE